MSGGGSGCWIKVVARNPRALAVNSQGGAQFGQKNILDQVISKLYSFASIINPTLHVGERVCAVFQTKPGPLCPSHCHICLCLWGHQESQVRKILQTPFLVQGEAGEKGSRGERRAGLC